MAVAPLPGAVREIGAQARQPRLHVGELRERRDRAAHAGVEVGLRPSPVRAEKPVDAIVRNRQRPRLDGPERAAEFVERRKDPPIDRRDLGKVLVDEPERVPRLWVPRQDDDALARDAHQVREPARAIRPMVHGQQRERGGERAVAERQIGGRRLHRRRRARRPLAQHRRRRLDGHDRPVARLVRAGAGAHVDHARRPAQRRADGRGQARVRTAMGVVAAANRVVELAAAQGPRSSHGSRRASIISMRPDDTIAPAARRSIAVVCERRLAIWRTRLHCARGGTR